MTDIEEALALLAAPCIDERFFQRALKALALVTQCRWAAFGRPSDKLGVIEIIAFCDLKHNVPGFEFTLKGSPCESIYQLTPPNTHILFPNELQSKFPHFDLIKKLGANSYQAELIWNDSGEAIGHILVMDSLPQSESVKSREFFRLLAQRIGVEYKRLLIARELALHKKMIAHTEQLMSFVDRDYQYHVVSIGYEKLFNRPSISIVGKTVAEIHGNKVFTEHLKPLLDRSLRGETVSEQAWIQPPHHDEPLFINVHHSPYYDEQGNIIGVIVSAHNITDLHHANEAIAHLANHDPLTGLYNRRAIFKQMEAKLLEQEQEQLQLAVFYIDLEGFREINETYGHLHGDKILKDVASRIKQVTHQQEVVARIGGDEFIILSSFPPPSINMNAQSILINRSKQLLADFKMTIDVEGYSLPISANIGHYLVENTDMELASIISHADKNMFESRNKQ
ncbi:GGDEF domain-containing protein [Shewanella sp. UCD-KL12]|uniref:sensor domain-containing diguanylate cyclase n=1 Tax=Shewanella sp. UCD-KL12 TaxID=1917163 RepID=UPI000970E1D5|nr:GGDEF domain-containing protein [Shewanella sp. UCD-KL12]